MSIIFTGTSICIMLMNVIIELVVYRPIALTFHASGPFGNQDPREGGKRGGGVVQLARED